MQDRIQLVSIAAALVVLVIIFELVRRRRLMERYALLWMGSGLVLLALAIWRGALTEIAHRLGIIYPPNALFLIAFGFVLLLLMHFSLAISRLSDQSKVLAQRLAILEERVRESESGQARAERDAAREEPESTSGSEGSSGLLRSGR